MHRLADAFLGEPDALDLTRSIRLNLDCAEICDAVGRVLTRQPETDLSVVRAAVEACAVECERHAAHHDHCRVCAEVCRRCEQSCRDLLAPIG